MARQEPAVGQTGGGLVYLDHLYESPAAGVRARILMNVGIPEI